MGGVVRLLRESVRGGAEQRERGGGG